MQTVHKHLIKRFGILKLIAIKKQSSNGLYRTIQSMLRHNWTAEQVEYHLSWELSMTKEYAQY